MDSTTKPEVIETRSQAIDSLDRRTMLKSTVVAAGSLSMPAIVRAQSAPKIRIGYWPVASGIPFFAAVDKGFFKQAGLEVEAVKFASPQQVAEAMLAGRLEGSSNGTASAALGIAELAQPGLLKIFCTNPTNAKYVLDEFIVAKDNTMKSVGELSGKKVGCGPGVQNVTLARTVLERAGAKGFTITELPIAQHVAAIAANQVDACYTLEPTGTIGRLNGTTRNLEVGVIAKYVLGDPMAPWHGGSASFTTEFISKNPEIVKRFITAYKRGVDLVKTNPAEARPSLKGYTAIEGPLTNEVPMADYMFSTEFKQADIAAFQKFFDLFSEKGIFSKRIMIDSILYKG
ncbi:MAG: ABC transporter substrate-binding protein [Betaproteobacteria bacterium]|jgi:NitT/TauT family transport system substrate-binding protein|nr:ABC transporter substrate-binding protein [Betaproteobacteria bacterium]NBP11479.1 ABC transporter substrate-binding protein [Betaproteobacteria bacterium]NBP36269.1 ABC transporter substrate-binding protein [Betaproteobacteria bacterium]NBT72268.1 ABC transporter substrate-binding protein [Betaproteobacteria bacterium]NBU02608.1 ABC transporter substrate-binding protein [Betaproteobacteria bacterium]